MPIYRKILVANRGEIALRVIRACKELDIATVAVYSDADRESAHVGAADEAYHLGPSSPSQSYLNADRLMQAARSSGADALHPGYGFFAENAAFARRCAAEGVAFLGPSPAAIERMGDKVTARNAAQSAGMPIVPGTLEPVVSADAARTAAKKLGFPVAIKAAAGGGGKGLKVARDAGEVEQAFSLAAREAAAYFKDDTLYLERYLARPKHVEVQILGDKHGRVLHLGERDCSLQRRHQKLVEETPASIGPRVRTRLHAAALKVAAAIGYDSAGTIECLVEGDDFFFLEMNTRIQVEHTITEMAWGVDLVKAQIRIAAGEPLWFSQDDVSARGHSIECRINAESPGDDFRPSPGRIDAYAAPAGPGVRVDSAASAGWVIPQEYDSLVAKLVVWGEDREEARRRMLRALDEFQVTGVDTTIPFLRALLGDPIFVDGGYATPDVDRFLDANRARFASSVVTATGADAAPGASGRSVTVEVNDKRFEVRVFGLGTAGMRVEADRARGPRFKSPRKVSTDGHSVLAPMHGIVADVKVAVGDEVRDGQVVAIVEAMKMMNEVVAHRAGRVASVDAQVGDTLETGAPIITFSL